MSTAKAWDKGPAGVMGPDEGPAYWQPAPTGGWVTLKYIPATFAFDAAACGIQVIPPGGRLPLRALRASELLWYVMSGSATALLDGKVHRLEAGSAVALGRQVPHSLENDGAEDLQLFFWVTPPGYEEILACIGRPRSAGDAAPGPFAEPEVDTGALSSPLMSEAEMSASYPTSGKGRVTVVGAHEGTSAHWQAPPARGYIQMKFTTANVASNRFGSGLQVLPPGGFIPPHAHTSNEEVLLIVRGRGQAIVDDVPMDVEPGSLAFVSRWVKHTIVNTGDENMYVLAIVTPLGGLDKIISMPGFSIPVVPGEPEPDWAGFDMSMFDEQEAGVALESTCLNLPFQVDIHNREAGEPAALRPISA